MGEPMLTLLLAIALSLLGTLACLVALWFAWVVVGTIGDIRRARWEREETRRKAGNERAVRDAIGVGRMPLRDPAIPRHLPREPAVPPRYPR